MEEVLDSGASSDFTFEAGSGGGTDAGESGGGTEGGGDEAGEAGNGGGDEAEGDDGGGDEAEGDEAEGDEAGNGGGDEAEGDEAEGDEAGNGGGNEAGEAGNGGGNKAIFVVLEGSSGGLHSAALVVGREEEAAGCRRHRVATSFPFFGHLLATLRTKLPLRLPALRTMEMQPIAQICCDRSPRRSNFRRRVPHPSPSPFLSLFPFSVSLPFSSPCLVPEELQQATIGGDEAANRLSEFLLQQAPTDLNRIQVLEAGLARQK